MKYKIDTLNAGTYYAKRWLTLFDGGSDQWLYVACDGLAYVFIDINDLPANCGRDATSRWAASVSVVDLLSVSPETMASAMEGCGCEDELDFKVAEDRLRLAEMLHSVGSKSPMWNQDGGKVTFDNYGNCEQDYDENCPAFRRLRKEAREYAEAELLQGDEQRNELLDNKVVNAIGMTAREYGNGGQGLWEGLRRIKAQGDAATPQQQLVLGMYQKAENTLAAGPVPEDLRS